MKTLSVLSVFLVSFLGVFSVLGASDKDDQGLVVQLDAFPVTILPYEPVAVSISVSNQLALAKKSVFSKLSSVAVQQPEKSWQTYIPFGFLPSPLDPRSIEIKPGETIEDFAFLCTTFTGAHIFNDPGTYLVKAGTPFGESVVSRVEVLVPPESERDALRFVVDKGLFHYFSKDGVFFKVYESRIQAQSADNDLNDLIQLYPESRYSKWARLSVLWIDAANQIYAFERGDKAGKIEKIHSIHMRLASLAESLPVPLNQYALQSSADLALKLGEDNLAHSRYEKVKGFSAASKYFSQLGNFAIINNIALKLDAKTVSTPPQSVLDNVVKELENKYYDIKGLPQSKEPWARDYRRKSLELYDSAFRGAISLDEARRRDSQMLKDCVMKYSTPLSPVEWKRRYEAYEQHEKEREAKQRVEQLKNQSEAERRLREARDKGNSK